MHVHCQIPHDLAVSYASPESYSQASMTSPHAGVGCPQLSTGLCTTLGDNSSAACQNALARWIGAKSDRHRPSTKALAQRTSTTNTESHRHKPASRLADTTQPLPLAPSRIAKHLMGASRASRTFAHQPGSALGSTPPASPAPAFLTLRGTLTHSAGAAGLRNTRWLAIRSRREKPRKWCHVALTPTRAKSSP